MTELLAPTRQTTRLTTAGRATLPAAAASLLLSWTFGGVIGLFAATAIAAVVLALLLGRLHGAGLRLSPPAPGRAHVGDVFQLSLLVTNASALAVRHLRVATGEGEGERLAGHRAHVPGRASVRVPVTHRLLRRGRQRDLRVTLSSPFPLGLIERRWVFQLPVDLLALPRLGSLHDLRALPRGRRVEAARARVHQRGDDELYSVRNWRDGESLRRVHWRLSARRGRRIVREMRREEEPPVHLWLAVLVPAVLPAERPRRQFERAVSLVATLAEHYLREERRVTLTLAGTDDVRIEAARGRAGLLTLLTALAEVQLAAGDACAPGGPVERATDRARHSAPGALIVVYVGSGAALKARADVLRLDVEHADTTRLFVPGRAWTAGAPLGLAGAAAW